jgi:lipoprotein-releasing system ATP-binding protein
MARPHLTEEAPSLSCFDLVRTLGKDETLVQVLHSVHLELHAGQAYSIVGPSGCGKSTLLYLLGLLDRPDSGVIKVGDIDTTQLADEELTRLRNRELGFVFQFHFLIKEFSALENVMLPMTKAGKFQGAAARARGMDLLKAVGLESKANRRANHLSGGEQQRVAVARALANQPAILLADEPTGNLDSENSDRVFTLLKKIVHEEKLTLLVVTHNPEIAEASDYVLHMQDGQFLDHDFLDAELAARHPS